MCTEGSENVFLEDEGSVNFSQSLVGSEIFSYTLDWLDLVGTATCNTLVNCAVLGIGLLVDGRKSTASKSSGPPPESKENAKMYDQITCP